jgi:hypothetical protein
MFRGDCHSDFFFACINGANKNRLYSCSSSSCPTAAHRILWQVSDSYGAFESHQDHQFGRCVCAWFDTDGGGIQQVNNK